MNEWIKQLINWLIDWSLHSRGANAAGFLCISLSFLYTAYVLFPIWFGRFFGLEHDEHDAMEAALHEDILPSLRPSSFYPSSSHPSSSLSAWILSHVLHFWNKTDLFLNEHRCAYEKNILCIIFLFHVFILFYCSFERASLCLGVGHPSHLIAAQLPFHINHPQNRGWHPVPRRQPWGQRAPLISHLIIELIKWEADVLDTLTEELLPTGVGTMTALFAGTEIEQGSFEVCRPIH